MEVIKPNYKIISMLDTQEIYKLVELAGRTCYKSEDKIKEGSAEKLIKRLIDSGHHSVIEHSSATVQFIIDRGVLLELTRHRLASFSAESTRYCNYSQGKFDEEITVIEPFFFKDNYRYSIWLDAMYEAEKRYMALLREGATPQEARSVLPNSLKTEVVVTANIREWRHILKLRCSAAAHPQIREVMNPLLTEFYNRLPVFFEDIKNLEIV